MKVSNNERYRMTDKEFDLLRQTQTDAELAQDNGDIDDDTIEWSMAGDE